MILVQEGNLIDPTAFCTTAGLDFPNFPGLIKFYDSCATLIRKGPTPTDWLHFVIRESTLGEGYRRSAQDRGCELD